MNATAAVQEFFEQYARSRTTLDVEGIGAQYTDSFMVAGPNGARVAERAAVLATLPKAQKFLEGLGHRSTSVVSVDQTGLDPRYVLARVQFLWRFENASVPQPVDVDVHATFILYINQGALTIVFQQERHDFQDLLRAAGLLPAKPLG